MVKKNLNPREAINQEEFNYSSLQKQKEMHVNNARKLDKNERGAYFEHLHTTNTLASMKMSAYQAIHSQGSLSLSLYGKPYV